MFEQFNKPIYLKFSLLHRPTVHRLICKILDQLDRFHTREPTLQKCYACSNWPSL